MALSRLSRKWLPLILGVLSAIAAAACGGQGTEVAKGTSVGSNEAFASPATSSEQSGWQTIFANQDWYLHQPGAEVEFSGILEAVPVAGGSSGLQRPAFYKLGSRALYTGGERPAPLEALTGQAVVIRGKSVEFALEGTQVQEIWPAAIRRGGP
jgi:hypothetical protein